MFRGGGGHRGGGSRRGEHGRGCKFTDALAQHPGIHYHEAITLSSGNRTRGSIPNVVRFIFLFIYF